MTWVVDYVDVHQQRLARLEVVVRSVAAELRSGITAWKARPYIAGELAELATRLEEELEKVKVE